MTFDLPAVCTDCGERLIARRVETTVQEHADHTHVFVDVMFEPHLHGMIVINFTTMAGERR